MRALPAPTGDGPKRSPLAASKKPGFEGQEARLAKAIGGKMTPGSGNSKLVSRKGDAVSELIRAEGKTTVKASISVKRSVLEKIEREAVETGLIAGFMFGFDPRPGAPLSDRYDWLGFRVSVAEAMIFCVTAVQAGNFEEARSWARQVRT